MQNSKIHLTLYPSLLEKVDWFTLHAFSKVNSFFHFLVKKEMTRRMKSTYPFGDKKGKIYVTIEDMYIKSVSCFTQGIFLDIPKERYGIPFIRNLIHDWFRFSFSNQEINLTHKLFKNLILLMNKKMVEEESRTLIFGFREDSYLENIIK